MTIKVNGCFSELPIMTGNSTIPKPKIELFRNVFGFMQNNSLALIGLSIAFFGLVV